MNITLEQAYYLYDRGFSLKVDADLHEVIIDDDEKEYNEYILFKISNEIHQVFDFAKINETISRAFSSMCTALGKALIKIGGE